VPPAERALSCCPTPVPPSGGTDGPSAAVHSWVGLLAVSEKECLRDSPVGGGTAEMESHL
jgi:hypothetical protein